MATLIASQPRIFWTCLVLMLCNVSAVFSQCEIQSVVVDSVLCNDNGTPNDSSDDFISFQAMVDRTNTADEYSISSDNGTVSSNFGTYETASSFLIPVAALSKRFTEKSKWFHRPEHNLITRKFQFNQQKSMKALIARPPWIFWASCYCTDYLRSFVLDY